MSNQIKIKGYGWKPSLPSIHVEFMKFGPGGTVGDVDLRSKCPGVYNQGQLGSCVGNSVAAEYEFAMMKQGVPAFTPSRLLIYLDARKIEGTQGVDCGSQIHDAYRGINQTGICDEKLWPYDITKFDQDPSADVYAESKRHTIHKYAQLNNTDINNLRNCLKHGFPFVFGFTVYSEFESDEVRQSGILPMPTNNSEMLGGHAVQCVGFNDASRQMIIRNSWGPEWGDGGYFYMPYEYITNPSLATDFWMLNSI